MRDVILQKLNEIEEAEDIRILHAVESGSRAWGFPSPDSDYDVRFLYIRRPEYYLKLEKTRDVLEFPIHDTLDINGWDLNKTLRLLHSSNPTLFEWMSSPVVYRKTDFYDRFLPVLEPYFSCKSGLHHYMSMAQGNYREFLKPDFVRLKKYFYVLRPLLACRWILTYRTRPPMLFRELLDAFPDETMTPLVEMLLDMKMNAPEIREIPRVDALNRYLDESFISIREQIALLPEEPDPGWERLNALFLSELARWEE